MIRPVPITIRTIMTELNLRKVTIIADYKVFGDPLSIAMDAFIEGAVQGNHEVLRHDLKGTKIKACQKCGGCWSKEVPCAILDDFNLIPDDLSSSHDLVIFAEGDFSASLKAALSKFYVFEKAPKKADLHKAYLVYLGSEAELKKQIEAFFEGIFELEPETSKVIRYEKITEKDLDDLGTLGFNF
jgi:multimeric flavodoxin WrbA